MMKRIPVRPASGNDSQPCEQHGVRRLIVSHATIQGKDQDAPEFRFVE
jgi:hypothetical protein